MIRWTNPQGFNLLPLLPGAAPEPGLSLKLGRDHSDYLQSRLNVSTGPRPARNKGGSFKEPILRRLTLYKTNLQSDEDEPSPTRPFFLCRTLLRNWRWASVHLLQGARTAHQVCAHCTWHNAHMAGEERTASLTGGERMADDDAHIHGQVPQV